MISKSYKDFRRFLEASGRLSKADKDRLIIDGGVALFPHNKESLFDDLPVSSDLYEDESANGIYGISHKDGELYVQSLKKLRQIKTNEKIDDYFLFPKEVFVEAKKLFKMEQPDFVHTHCHTEYSSLDGMSKCEDIARRCKQLGFKAVAITDHGTMAGVIEFYKACKKYDIKPIIGQEFYLDEDRFQKGPPQEFLKSLKKGSNRKQLIRIYEKEHRINLRRHIVLLAKNETGLKNLYKLSSIAYREGFYYRPRIDWDLLEKYHKGVIATTACMGGIIAAEDDKNAVVNLRMLVKIFGKEDLYLEVMLINYKDQPAANDKIFALAKKYDVKTICTVDSHFVDPDRDHIHRLYMQIGAGYTYGEGDNYLKVDPEMMTTYKKFYSNCEYKWKGNYDIALRNTLEIADKCNVEIELGKFRLPKFNLKEAQGYQEGDTKITYMNRRIMEGWNKKIVPHISKDEHAEYKARLMHEMKTLIEAGYVDYLLIVLDAIDHAKEKKIPFSVRGSAAGSIVCYLLDITKPNPIKRKLLFERFVSPTRMGGKIFEPKFD